jgi:MFS family permease
LLVNKIESTSLRRLDLAVLAQFLATGITISAVPALLLEELRQTRAVTGAATTIFFVAALIARPFIGRFLDAVGRRPFLLWPPLINAALVLLLELASSPIHVGALRFLSGAVGAGFYTAALALTTDLAPADRQTRAVGRLSVFVYLGFVIGPLLFEALLQIGFVLVWVVIAILHVVASVCALGLPGGRPGTVSETLGTMDSDAPGSDRRAKGRLLHPAAVGPGLVLLTVAFAQSTVTAFAGDYGKQLGLEYPRLLLGAFALAVLVIRIVSGPFADRRGPFAVAVPGLLLGTVGLLVATLAPNIAVGFLGMVIIGIGSGSSFPAITTIVTQRAAAAERGVAVASLLMFNDVGQAVSAPLSGWVGDRAGWRWVFGVPTIVAAFGALGIVVLQQRFRDRNGAN